MTSSLHRTVRVILRGALLGVTLLLAARAAEARKTYDVPAGPATTALQRFAEISGRETLFAAEAVRGVTTNAVKGELTPQEALDRMLAGTGLAAAPDAKTGAFAVKRAAANPAKNAVSPVADSASAAGPVVKMQEMEVTGSRMRLHSGEQPVQPVLTLTSLDIERTGASNLGQLFQYIPAVTSYSSGLVTEYYDGNLVPTASSTSARTSAQLRGGAESATLLLVDGKRVARTGQQNGGGVGFDLGGIPLAAVERVEVLLDGASAIYGSDAINGVINVILKKRYAGTEFRLTYDNTFNKDAGVKTASLTHGFARGKWSGLITLSATTNNIQLMADRRYTATFDRRLFGGTINNLGTVYAEENGSLSRAAGLPGLTTTVAGIPGGTSFTVADYASAPLPPLGFFATLDRGIMATNREINGYTRLAYEFSDALTISGYVRRGQKTIHDQGSYRRAFNITLPAGYPGNPFGVPVVLNKVFWDLPKVYTKQKTRNDEYALSASGKLPREWRYEAGVNYNRGVNDTIPQLLPGANNAIGTFNMNATPLNAAIAAGQQPKLIYDSRSQTPNGPRDLDALFVNTGPFVLSDLAQTWTYSAQADGPVYEMWAGKIQLVVGAEYREEYAAFPHAAGVTKWPSFPQRKVSAGFAETRIPIVAQKNQVPFVNQLDLSVAARKEKYNDAGGALTPRYGVIWRPVSSVLLRGSVGKGFIVAPLYQTAPATTRTQTSFGSGQIDPARGNQNLTGQPVFYINGGNPGLRPQKSENWTYGAVLDVPKVKSLSLSFDYFDYKFTDRFGGGSGGIDVATRVTYLPWLVTRGPNLPGDPAGWPGPIIEYDNRNINLSAARVSGYDFGVRWSRRTAWGEFALSSTGERILRDESRVLPTSPPIATINKKFRPMRITTSLSWSRGAWDASILNTYQGKYWVNSTNETLSPSRYTDDVMRWDAGLGYDFGQRRGFGAAGESWWRRALHDTKWRVTIINVLNSMPPMDSRGTFSSAIIDPRLRRYIVDFTKRF